MTRRTPDAAALQTATQFQRAALDHRASVWISANAGTGKTEVLTYRIIALLLHNPDLQPSSILGLTFTTAAAAEMATRLNDLLHEWNKKADDALRTQLQNVFGNVIDDATLKRFRQLPALVADTPPTLTTIHGFAQQVLARMGDGDGLPQPFTLVENLNAQGLLPAALSRAIHHATAEEEAALNNLLAEFGDNGWREISSLFENKWQALGEVVALGHFDARLREALNLSTGEAALEKALLPTSEEIAALQTFAAARAEAAEVLQATDHRAAWLSYLFIKEGEGTPARQGFPALKKDIDANLAAADVLRRAQERVGDIRDQLRGWQSYRLTMDLVVWWSAVKRELTELKTQRRLKTYGDFLDEFEDRLTEAAQNDARGQWLAQRLERRYAHLLVDEAQDNSPQQARLVQLLARVFLSGDVGTGERSVLAVGDPKQGIYRFQGARQELFNALQDFLKNWSGGRFVSVRSAHSFRASAPLLQAVENTFADDAARALVGGWLEHQTVYPHAWGRVEVWPLTIVPTQAAAPSFVVEAQPQIDGDGATLFGAQLAAWLHNRVAEGCIMPSSGTPLGWGDVLVLVQRNSTAMALAGALGAAGIPAVAIGGKGLPPPVVNDVIALLRYLNGNADRLALAQILKSPLCGWSDAQLLNLAQNNWQLSGEVATWLAHWQARAAAVPPYIWLAELLQRPEVFTAYAARGPLPAAALQTELAGLVSAAQPYATMADLLAAWETTPPQPLGPLGEAAGVVRVMTVHKAKGLGAPLVVVAETIPSKKREEKILWQRNEHDEANLMLVRRVKAIAPELQTQLEKEETRRVAADQASGLYVALTRAKDWLVIGGWEKQKEEKPEKDPEKKKPEPTHWYGQASKAAAAWRDENGVKILEAGTLEKNPPAAEPITATAPLAPAAPLQPFAWPVEEPFIPEREAALQRGTLQHRLLHALAPLPPQQRYAQGGNLLALWHADAALLPPVLAVFEQHPQLFAAQSEGEVPLVVGESEGRIDRLVETGNEILIVDFKTEIAPPASVPEKYRQQLAAYAHSLAAAYPAKKIRSGILWLTTNQLNWLD